MTDPDLALARSRLYDVLARVVLEGPTGDVLDGVAMIPPLAEALPDEDAEEAAARHHDVIDMELLPWANVVLDPDGQLGGPIAGEADEWVDSTGLVVPGGVEPDHVGVLLRGLAATSATESEGVQADPVPGLDLLLRALPPIVAAVRSLGDPLYTVVFELAVELVASHRAEIGPPPAWELPDPGLALDDPSTGLSDIARLLVSPARSGLLVTRTAIDRWAAAGDVPRGFGGRRETLESLLLGSADHGAMAAVLNAIAADLAAAAETYASLADLPVPVGPWRDRLAATEALVARIRASLP